MTNFGSRLKTFRKMIGKTQIDMALELGYKNHTGYLKLESGAVEATTSITEKIHRAYPTVNLHWLLTGEGDIYMSEEEQKLLLGEGMRLDSSDELEIDKENTMYISNNIKYLRLKKGFTQKEIAGKVGVTPSQITHYEKGSSLPSLEVAQKMANLFGIDLGVFVNNDLNLIESESNSIKLELKEPQGTLSERVEALEARIKELEKKVG